MKQSNCCKAPIVDETDICSKCGEHCIGLTDWYEEIQQERERQISIKGYTAEHDDEHSDYFLIDCAASYIMLYAKTAVGETEDLLKAAALIIAELERLERVENEKNYG